MKRLALIVAIIIPMTRVQSQPQLQSRATFTEHVAPIVLNVCATCHRPGEAAPFSLLTYEDVRKRGKLLATVTQSRYMPPWHADSGFPGVFFLCRPARHARRDEKEKGRC